MVTSRPSYPTARLDYDLPTELIAQRPAPRRTGSRLLYVDVQSGTWHDRKFTDLLTLLPERTLIYLNDSKVIPARVDGARASGGSVELLYLEYLGAGVVQAIIGSNAKLPAGEVIDLPEGWHAELLEPKALDGVKVRLTDSQGAPTQEAVIDWLQRNGEVPLPPYIHERSDRDRERYQTVYAAQSGSVAAPTAGLHFTQEMLDHLPALGHAVRRLTLHVGVGTFVPLRVDDLKDHVMHEEPYSVAPEVAEEYLEAHAAGRPILAVGTTSLRILHTLRNGAPPSGRTSAFIYPGHCTNAARLLLTNFHLPRSTLLALVYAFGGEELMRDVYAHAVRARYRFFSYGDCMLIDRRQC